MVHNLGGRGRGGGGGGGGGGRAYVCVCVCGGGGGGGLFHIVKYRCRLKIVFVQNSNNCRETLNGTAYLIRMLQLKHRICLKTNQPGRVGGYYKTQLPSGGLIREGRGRERGAELIFSTHVKYICCFLDIKTLITHFGECC